MTALKLEGVSESRAKHWLAGRFPFLWSFGRLGDTDLVPRY